MPSKYREKDMNGEKSRPKSSHSSRRPSSSTIKDSHRRSVAHKKSITSDTQSSIHTPAMSIPELGRRSSMTSSSYPSFSKAHSKESVRPGAAPYTPESTALDGKTGDKIKRTSSSKEQSRQATRDEAPPSPPLTAVEPDGPRSGSRSSMRKVAETVREEMEQGRRSVDSGSRTTARPKSKSSSASLRKRSKEKESSGKLSSRSSATKLNSSGSGSKPKPAVVVEEKSDISRNERPSSAGINVERIRKAGSALSVDSQATSVARDRKAVPLPSGRSSRGGSSPVSCQDSSPRTPTGREPHFAPIEPTRKATPVVEVHIETNNNYDYDSTYSAGDPSAYPAPPPPPPPPPPPVVPQDVPRVDYLLQNGGLTSVVPRNFMLAGQPAVAQQFPAARLQSPPRAQVEKVFSPFNDLLEDYSTVLSKKGSLAVATGYKSIARRLLDRLEAVFARNISSEHCHCSLCQSKNDTKEQGEETWVSWGEVLEFVSGRRELPQWPPFSLINEDVGLGIHNSERRTPMQQLDIDVPEEFREHYIRQSRKTKDVVDKWLASQPEQPSSAPQEVDDDTLTFAILTRLEPEQRQGFMSLMGRSSTFSGSRAPTPTVKSINSEQLSKTGLALQRLYRLPTPPREPEAAVYLLNNSSLHVVLATLAAISQGEWDVLVSGRFDGFLWSGIEYPPTASILSNGPSRGPTPLSRGPTPYSPERGSSATPFRTSTPFYNNNTGAGSSISRGATPAPGGPGAPLPMDEEAEIAVLAEVEREIYMGMEALEDAFEALHSKAEIVRSAIRERSTGLALASQARKGSMASNLDARLGTPASGIGGWESENDEWIDDGLSELAPDDSASNVSSSRIRRPKRRNERRTPAPVEEEGSDIEAEMARR
ncbi:hypothetical protein L228DRAFT_243278 [Xylona heveae TC161]|uniref:5-Methylcytosine G/T mismatch-specific DNA glycosylase n=1 Tax=Xylona heveae (strain CBS 132557 / TC161) TaxID=1328760 RepID=A0A165JXX7_XYLHT|nr:hypothetical protein L228DRAFT_243278 [Xylona heveae TC161]KZF26764.1 hypothetical protein L228DRAFT_243278 [Xylona heveae TC161]